MDIEVVDAVTDDVVPAVLTERERRWVAHRDDARRWIALLFAAKEAVSKSLWGLTVRFVGFHDAEIDIDTARGMFAAWLVHPADRDIAGGAPLRAGSASGVPGSWPP